MGTVDRPLDEAIEEIVLGAQRRYTRLQVSEAAGLDLDEGRRLWRSLGFAEVADDAVLFTERDTQAVRLMRGLAEAGVLEPDVREAVARAVAQQMSRLAEWQVGLVKRIVESRAEGVTAQQALETTAAVLPALEALQTYVWRRHLAATVHRLLATSGTQEEAPDTWSLVVGFADMVGFTRTTRRRSTVELGEMIERFGSTTTEVIADGHGRIVKTVGDEVLFVADEIADGAAIALGLHDRVRGEPLLPRCGSAWPPARSSCGTGTSTAKSSTSRPGSPRTPTRTPCSSTGRSPTTSRTTPGSLCARCDPSPFAGTGICIRG